MSIMQKQNGERKDVATVHYPPRPVGHLGWLENGFVKCSWCHRETPVGAASPPFTVVCRGCRCNVRVESGEAAYERVW